MNMYIYAIHVIPNTEGNNEFNEFSSMNPIYIFKSLSVQCVVKLIFRQ